MKKSLRVGSLVTVGVGLGATAVVWFANKPNRIQAKMFLREWKRKLVPPFYSESTEQVIEKGGNPNPHDFEDNNMVSEGSMYSVGYYNDKFQ